jgi:hypothetical protein
VTQSRLQQIPDFNSRKGILGATGPEANQVWVCEPNLGGVLNKKEGNEVALTQFFFATTRAFLSPRRSANFA